MSVSISDKHEQILEQAVRSGLFQNQQEALCEAIRLLGEKATDLNDTAIAVDTWRALFKQHIANTPAAAATFVDDSREFIYEGRGE